MDADRCRFLFGSDVAPLDVDDDDELIDFFERELAARDTVGLDRSRALMRLVVARQVLRDEPPATWATAQRLLAAGMDRSLVLNELTMAAMVEVQRCLEDGGAGFDEARYASSLATLPLPTVDEIDAAVDRVAATRPGIPLVDLEDAVVFALGRDDDGLAASLVTRVIEHGLDDDGRLLLLAEDRVAHLPSLTAGAVLTHQLTETDVELGVLNCIATDLAPFAWMDDVRLASGEPLDMFSAEAGHLAWKGPEGWLASHAAGDVVAVRVIDGIVTLASVPPPVVDPRLVKRVASVHERQTRGSELPLTFVELAVGLLLDDDEVFDAPRPPLHELCDEAGLAVDGSSIASGPEQWANRARAHRTHRVFDAVDGDADAAKVALRALETLTGETAPAEQLRTVLREMHGDPLLCGVVIDEVLDVDLEHGDVDAAAALVERLVAVAARPVEKALAHWFAALVEERGGSVMAADAHIHLASLEDPEWGPLIDRAGWYASDRGDAAAAVRWWRLLEAPDRHELATVARYAQRSGPKLGRNDPCWCGSGRKFKSCHQGRSDQPALPDRADWLWAKAAGYLLRRGGEVADDLYELTVACALDPDDPDSAAEAMSDPIVFDTALVEYGWFERFVHDRGALLPDDEALLAASWALVDRTVYEIEDVGSDGLVVRDLRTGDRLTVATPGSSRLQAGSLVCARAVPDGKGHRFVGAQFPVAPGREQQVLDLCDDADAEGLCEYVAALHAPPRITTREHEDIVECAATMTVPHPAEAQRVLDTLYEPDDNGWVELHEIEPGEQIVRATLRLAGTQLTVSTNATERMDRVRATLTAHVPGLVVVDVKRTRFRPGVTPTGLPMPGPQSIPVEARDEIVAKLEARWLDDSVPALGGLTPRQAAADPTRRADVLRLLATFPTPDPTSPFMTMDPRRIRKALGL